MWVEALLGVPHPKLLAVFPLLSGPSPDRIAYPTDLPPDLPRYPLEKHVPDCPHPLAALWMGQVFDVNAAVLAVTAGLDVVPWPPPGAKQEELIRIRGIGSIWIGPAADAARLQADWMARARALVASPALGGEGGEADRQTIRRMLAFIEEWTATNNTDR